ncbi:MAG: SRPBCC domain-containing protein [Bacteroidales bacterium]|jgi:activator of HSP90 ATPase|nr:SRPBCC domain-containing protein [Bacteroidales bacterium]
MPDNIKLSVTLPVEAKTIYNAWFDREAHSSFSKGKADIQKKVGSKFTAGDGFIEGEISKMVLGKQIVMSWRTTEFPEGSEDSQLTVNFEKLPNGTKVIVVHENLPEDEGKKYRKEWKDNYFTPMKAYFV